MIRTWFTALPGALRTLLAINVVFFLLWALVLAHLDSSAEFVRDHLALQPAWPGIAFEPWQLITYSVVHLESGFSGTVYMLLNMLWLYWIGQDLEDLYGSHKLLSVYVWAALGGGLFGAMLQPLVQEPDIVVHGASGAVMGVMAALTAWQPSKQIRLWLIGQVRLLWVLFAYVILVILSIGESVTGPLVHVLGGLTGWGVAKVESKGLDVSSWAKWFLKPRGRPLERLLVQVEQRLAPEQKPGPTASAVGKRRRKASSPGPIHAEEELDRILDKINEEGLDAISAQERAILESFSRSK